MTDNIISQDFVQLKNLVLPAVVSLICAFQLAMMARQVGKSRMKFKINYPLMTGDPVFERTLRAQQNSVEFFPIFLTCLWVSALFFHQVPAAMVGMVYAYARHQYFHGYCKSVEGRLPGFKLGIKSMMTLLGMAVAGLVTNALRTYTEIDLANMVFGFIGSALPLN